MNELDEIRKTLPEGRKRYNQICALVREREAKREGWLRKLVDCEAIALSILVPLSLGADLAGSQRICITAAQLLAGLSILAGAVRLHASVLASEEIALEAFEKHRRHRKTLGGNLALVSKFAHTCGHICSWLAAASLVALMTASVLSCL